jgi:hypothetical protein
MAGGMNDHPTNARRVDEFVHLGIMGKDEAFCAEATVISN